ncbi:type II secretion system F family protein [Corynebacterium vitaeruminis]|uniref:type II secretion system F family protein n=1 Tax=Corynebacterium vitaeruminis TaxID=38305 RepID=UPI001EFA2539|nr:type II secretion system F family protein [Corynebacterium vitaeruminis]
MTVLIGGAAAAVAIWQDSSAAARSRALAGRAREVPGGLKWLQRMVGLGAGATDASAAITGGANRAAGLSVLITAGLAFVLLWGAGIPGAIAALLLGRTAGAVVRAVRERRCERREADSAAVALETLIAQLRAGAAASRALNAAATELRRSGDVTVLADHLGHAAHRANFADPWETEESSEQLRRIGRMWTVAQQHGLSLAGLLECARGDLQARQAHRSQTSAALAGPRMTIAILASLPVFGLIMGQAFGASPFEFLSRGIGGIVLVIGVGLVCAGIEWAVAIIDRAEVGQ